MNLLEFIEIVEKVNKLSENSGGGLNMLGINDIIMRGKIRYGVCLCGVS